MIQKSIVYFDQPAVISCDANCRRAWGINTRPRVQLSDEVDDYEFKADGELARAPIDPGTYEGRDAKPRDEYQRLNRWCCRECERCVMTKPGEPVVLPDFSKRVKNKHG